MKLISTEIDGSMIQLTYTGGLPENKSDELLVVRLPFEGNLKRSMLWHQMNVANRLAEWAGEESRRIRNELEKLD